MKWLERQIEREKKEEEDLKMALLASAFADSEKTFGAKGSTVEKKEIYSPWLTLGKWRIGRK